MWLSSGKPQKERYLQANEEFQNRQGEDSKGLINADSILSLKYWECFPTLEDPGVDDEYITVAPDATIGKIDVWNF